MLKIFVNCIDGFREAILGGESRLYVLGFALSLALAVVLLASGTLYFRKMERTFADAI